MVPPQMKTFPETRITRMNAEKNGQLLRGTYKVSSTFRRAVARFFRVYLRDPRFRKGFPLFQQWRRLLQRSGLLSTRTWRQDFAHDPRLLDIVVALMTLGRTRPFGPAEIAQHWQRSD